MPVRLCQNEHPGVYEVVGNSPRQVFSDLAELVRELDVDDRVIIGLNYMGLVDGDEYQALVFAS